MIKKLVVITLATLTLNSTATPTIYNNPITQTKDGVTVEVSFPADAQNEYLRKLNIFPAHVTITNSSNRAYTVKNNHRLLDNAILKYSLINERVFNYLTSNTTAGRLGTGMFGISLICMPIAVFGLLASCKKLTGAALLINISSGLMALLSLSGLSLWSKIKQHKLLNYINQNKLGMDTHIQPGKTAEFVIFFDKELENATEFNLELLADDMQSNNLVFNVALPTY